MADRRIEVVEGRTIVVEGTDLVSAIAASAAVDRDRAETAADQSENAAASALAAGNYYPSQAAGEAATAINGAYATDDGSGNLIVYKRTVGGSTEIARIVTPGDGPIPRYATTLAGLRAIPSSVAEAIYKGATFAFETSNAPYTADDVNVVKANDAALSVGARVRQGADKIRFVALGASAPARSAEARFRDTVSLADYCTTADATLGFNRIKALYPGGCKIFVPSGNWTLTDTVTFDGQRVTVEGAGRNVSIFVFNPATPKPAFLLSNPALGGIYQSSISDIGFASANTIDKTAIELRNAADTRIARIAIATNAWQGALSRGVANFGRQSMWFSGSQIACAQPLFIGPNPVFPTLVTDHNYVHDNELIGTSATKSVITIGDGVTLSQVTFARNALAGGKHGIEWNDTTSVGASDMVRIVGLRTEQGLDPAGYSIYLVSTVQNLQSLQLEHVLFDSARNGMYLRRVHRVVGDNVFFNQGPGQVAIDMLGIANSELDLRGGGSQVGGARTLNGMREVERSPAFASGSLIGPREFWRYEPSRPFASNAQSYADLMPVRHQGVRTWVIRDTLPVGSNTVTLPLLPASLRASAQITVRTSAGAGQAGYGIFMVRPDGTIDTVSRLGNVNQAGGANTCRIVAGANLQLLGDALGGAINYTLKIEAEYAS